MHPVTNDSIRNPPESVDGVALPAIDNLLATPTGMSLTTPAIRARRGRNSNGRDGKRTGNTGRQLSLTVNNGHRKPELTWGATL